MKKLFFILLFAAASNAFAQSTLKEDVDIIQSIYGKSKKDLVGQYMKIDPAKADAFWKIYDEYEVKRKELVMAKVQLINDYAMNYNNMTEAKANELAEKVLKNNIEYEKLFQKYYGKMKGVIGSISAVKFIQLEIYLQTAIRSSIQDAVPFIGELDKTVPHQH